MVTDRDRAIVRWVAVIGAASAPDVMARFCVGRTVAYRRLAALVEHGLLARSRLVYGQPTCTRRPGRGWRGPGCRSSNRRGSASRRRGIGRCARGSPSSSNGPSAWRCGASRGCARPSSWPIEPVASAQLGHLPDGRPRLRRPDLVLFPDGALPVTVEESLQGGEPTEPALIGDGAGAALACGAFRVPRRRLGFSASVRSLHRTEALTPRLSRRGFASCARRTPRCFHDLRHRFGALAVQAFSAVGLGGSDRRGR